MKGRELLGGVNQCVVSVQKKAQDELRTSSGIKLYLDTTWHPEVHVTTFGRIEALPSGIDTRVLGFEGCGDWNAKVGDLCYFHYLTVDDDSEIRWGSDVFYSAPLHRVFCTVEGGEVRMLGDWEMVEPMGYRLPEKVNGFHVPESIRDREYECIGRCLTGKYAEKVVIFKPYAKFMNKVEGRDVFLMKNQMILGYYDS